LECRDEVRELRERRLEAVEGERARTEDERAERIALELLAFG